MNSEVGELLRAIANVYDRDHSTRENATVDKVEDIINEAYNLLRNGENGIKTANKLKFNNKQLTHLLDVLTLIINACNLLCERK